MSTRQTARAALLVAATCVAAQIAVPLPLGVPFTVQPPAVSLTSLLLAPGAAAAATGASVLLGAAGLPVCAGYTGGPHVPPGPSGGFRLVHPRAVAVVSALAGPRAGFGRGPAAAAAGPLIIYGLGAAAMAAYLRRGLGRAVVYLAATFHALDAARALVGPTVAPRVRWVLGG